MLLAAPRTKSTVLIDGEALRRVRMSVPMSQRELADAAKMSEPAIRNLESGRNGRTYAKNFRSLADALGMTVEKAKETLSPKGHWEPAVESPDSITIEPLLMLRVYDRDVAAGPFSLVDTRAEPDALFPIPRNDIPKGATISALFVLRIAGDSMSPKYSSGDRLIMEELPVTTGTLASLKSGSDYCVCQMEDGCTFKELVKVDASQLVPALKLAARNKKKYPEPMRVAWTKICGLSRCVGRIRYEVSAID
jgi:transcriptional regulator with XRE-family HTH domain